MSEEGTERVEKEFVRVLYDFSYKDGTGKEVRIVKGQELRLLKRSTDDWWSVRCNVDSKRAFFVPSNYVETFMKMIERKKRVDLPTSPSFSDLRIKTPEKAEDIEDVVDEEVVGEALDLLDSVLTEVDEKEECHYANVDPIYANIGSARCDLNDYDSQTSTETTCTSSVDQTESSTNDSKKEPEEEVELRSRPGVSADNQKRSSNRISELRNSVFGDDKPKQKQPQQEKSGKLWRAKIAEDGKKVNPKKVDKLWIPSYAVISGTTLFCYKDVESAQMTGSIPTMPDLAVQLLGAEVEFGAKGHKIRKETVFQVSCVRHVFLFFAEKLEDCHEWYLLCRKISMQQSSVKTNSLPRGNVIEADTGARSKFKSRGSQSKIITSPLSPTKVDIEKPDKSVVLERLRAFFIRRPSQQTLQAKGIIKDTVFGAPLAVVCKRDKSTVPKFLRNCIEAIEKRGIDEDHAEGMYRVPANMSKVNKLRNAVDQDLYNLDSSEWTFHVLCGALKLFLREMSDSLIPTDTFEKLIKALGIPDTKKKVAFARELLNKLPQNNLHTLKFLLQHLLRVKEKSAQNKMGTNALAIVFGPNLFKPDILDERVALYAAYQNQIVQFFLDDYSSLFPN